MATAHAEIVYLNCEINSPVGKDVNPNAAAEHIYQTPAALRLAGPIRHAIDLDRSIDLENPDQELEITPSSFRLTGGQRSDWTLSALIERGSGNVMYNRVIELTNQTGAAAIVSWYGQCEPYTPKRKF